MEHVGDSDKPITTIEILTGKDTTLDKDNIEKKSFVVNKNIYKALVETVIKNKSKKNVSHNGEYGTFRVEIKSHNNSTAEYIFGRNESMHLFQDIEYTLKKDKETLSLKSAIQTNLKRINYY